MAVIGVDDFPSAALTVPALATVAFDLHEVGRERANTIAAALTGSATTPSTTVAPSRVIDRAST
ncbi:substrate-binding domain-containing protein [Streptomyces sp. NPDC048430]|uniref:substrate-binding domain-containing protein n=1 Tax=Streptomyces sp. NPDC048430 TaxID=3155388 RepID=UPI0034353FF3